MGENSSTAGDAVASDLQGSAPSTPIQKNEPDLTTEDGVRAYLAGTPFAARGIDFLSGGTANWVYRLWLEEPFEGRTTVVLKHTKPYVRGNKDLAFTDERQAFEVEALKRVASWLPSDSLVQVPRIHKFDRDVHAVIMDDAGEGSVTLKDFMKQGGPSVEMAVQIGKGLGEFLGSVHAWGTEHRAECEIFQGHTEAKAIAGAYYYGQLVPFFSGNSWEPKLQDPPLVADDATLSVLKEVAEETSKALVSANDHFVQGDFWPGNMLLSLDDQGQLKNIMVVDWEMARIGLPGMEVGQFAAEIFFCGRFHPDVCTETFKAVLEGFFSLYASNFTVTEELARRALVHFGTHLAVIGPTVGWGEKNISREVALEGAKAIVEAHGANMDELKKSFVGGLLGGR